MSAFIFERVGKDNVIRVQGFTADITGFFGNFLLEKRKQPP